MCRNRAVRYVWGAACRPSVRVSLARVRGDDEVHVGGVLDGVLKDGVDGHAVVRRQLAHSLDDAEVIPATAADRLVGWLVSLVGWIV